MRLHRSEAAERVASLQITGVSLHIRNSRRVSGKGDTYNAVMFRKLMCALIPLAGLATAASAGQLIQNGDFLQPQYDPSNPGPWYPDPGQGPFVYGSATYPIPYWTTTGSAGVWEPTNVVFNSIPGGGNSAGWTSDGLNWGFLTQDTGYDLKAGDSLSLSYYIGDRMNLLSMYDAITWGEVTLFAGNNVVYDQITTGPGTTGNWTFESASLSAGQLAPYVGDDLTLQLVTRGYVYPYYEQASWVGVSLVVSNAVPEPAPFAALAAGLGLLGLLRRKRA